MIVKKTVHKCLHCAYIRTVTLINPCRHLHLDRP